MAHSVQPRPAMRKIYLTILCLGLALNAFSCKDDASEAEAGETGETGDGDGDGDGDGLQPCDALADAPCGAEVCAGTPSSGFYCRPPCTDAEVGDACGESGVCLDASPVDGGKDMACFELTSCDFLSGDGCDLGAGESCVVVDFDPVRTACVPSGDTGVFEPCDGNMKHDCAPGLACLGSDVDSDDPDPGSCTPLCKPGESLPDDCAQCIDLNPDFGTCAECNIVDNDCPAGEQCHPANEALGGVCTGFGPGGPGDGCNPVIPEQSCQEGFLCMEQEDDVFTCVEKCDPGNPMCMDELACVDIGLFSDDYPEGELGLCIDAANLPCDPGGPAGQCPGSFSCIEFDVGSGICLADCDPTDGNAACMGNYACMPTKDDMFFLDTFYVGNGACGSGCANDGECGGGETCLLLDGLTPEGVCGTTCDPQNPACGGGETCIATAADPNVGACMPGPACDPADVLSCFGNPAGSCVALDGMAASGACLYACAVQDPNACGQVPGECNERTDPEYHSGACIGQDQSCDAAAQSGCEAGQTCDIFGGGPVGGQSYVCDDAGMAPEGTDCSQDGEICGEGLTCHEAACRAWCDPNDDQCAVGTCTDLSASFYLPANSLGVCLP